MKFHTSKTFLGLLSLVWLSTAAAAQKPVLHVDGLPELDLEMTGAEYQAIFRKQAQAPFNPFQSVVITPDGLDPVLQFGTRNLAWLTYMNQYRPDDKKFSFSSEATQVGYPVDQAKSYNPKLILARYNDVLAALPVEMKKILVEGQEFPQTPPLAESVYLEFGLKVDRIYQEAARWRLLGKNLLAMAARKRGDVRGYYYLTREANLAQELTQFASLPPEKRAALSSYLVNICYNSEPSESGCQAKVDSAAQQGTLNDFLKKYLPGAQALWNSYFTISYSRDDVTWHPGSMSVPFLRPEKKFQDFLTVNIEDEWRWANWQLKLDFQDGSKDMPRLEFVPGTTPHVNGLAGNVITMDANQPLTEYNVKWTIRHEYGHVLGFPDCYIEFYDLSKEEMVSYQLDITNLMCSRKGKLKQTHYDELARVYSNSL